MPEVKENKLNKNTVFKYVFAGLLIVLSVSIVFYVCRNIYLSGFSRNNEETKNSGNNSASAEEEAEPTEINFYSEINRIELKKTGSLNFNVDDVKTDDEYNNLQFSFILDKDYLSSFNDTEFDFKNDIFNGLSVSNNENGLTVLTIKENDIYGFKLSEDNDYYYITGGEPKDIYDWIVVLDAGHGGKDPGCQGFGFDEKDICLDIVLKTEEYLNKEGYVKAYLTRSDDTFLQLGERVKIAEKLGDILVSVHINSNEDYPDVSGTEVYYYNKSFNDVQYITGDECAEFLCDRIALNFGSKRRENKTENYEVIATSDIPSVLCEVGFISNEAEAEKLGSEEGKNNIAKGLSEGITSIFKVIESNKGS